MQTVMKRGYMRCEDDERSAVIKAMAEHIRLSRLEPGCLRFDLTQNPSDPNRFDYDEEFVDQAAYKAHQVRNLTSPWFYLTAHMKREVELI